ncbi:MAG: cytochrome-c peroxidase [Thermoanaerobaculia bacterium]
MAAVVVVAAAAAQAQLPPPPEPPGNPLTASKANLGKVLFWDEQVSSTGTAACGTCHFPLNGGEDPRSATSPGAVHPGPDGRFGGDDDVLGSPGVPRNLADGLYDWSPLFGLLEQVTRRNSVPALNAGYAPELFWDGRAPGAFVDPVTGLPVPGLESGAALESQAVGPPVSDVEMGHVGQVWLEVLARLAASVPLALSPDVPAALLKWMDGRSYPELFAEAFGTPEVTAPGVAMAIASYERTQFTDQTPFDEMFTNGTELLPQEQAGLDLFNGTGDCNNFHIAGFPTFLFSDNTFRYTGVRPQAEDPGRMEVTGLDEDQGRMRVPSLRNVELRAPFMHNGRFATLEEVIDFYDRGGDFDGENKDILIHPLGLSEQDKADLLAFLTRPLTDPRVALGLPPFDRPTLYTESSRVPTVEGSGQPGSGDFVPLVVALEPPVMGNPSFTVGVWNALGGAEALLVIDDADPGLVVPTCAGQFVCAPVVLQGAGAGAGFGSFSVAIPNEAALDEAEWFGRWYVDDAGGGFPAAVSQVFRFKTYRGRQLAAIFADGFESGNTSAWDAAVP